MSSYEILLACAQCKQLLVKPLNVPCGFNVCEKHIFDESLTFSPCLFCKENHSLPLKRNITFAELIDNFNKALCAEAAVKNELASYKSSKQQPGVYFEELHSYFDTFKRLNFKSNIEFDFGNVEVFNSQSEQQQQHVNAEEFMNEHAEWITTCLPLHSQSHYVPQVGDQCVYVSQAHMSYLSKVMEKKLCEVNRNKLYAAIEGTKLFDQEQECRVKCLTVAAYPPSLMHLRLETKLEATQKVTTFEIDMYVHAGLDDFLFLKEFYDRAMAVNWKQGSPFRRIIDGEWHTCHVKVECSNTCKFRSLCVMWDLDNRVEFLSPWDLEPLNPDQ
jgi:hypothetical protein